MQKVIGPIRIFPLYRTFFFFIFSWPYYVLPMPKFKPQQINNKSKTVMRCDTGIADRHYYQFIYLYMEPFISTKLFKSSNTVTHPEVSIVLSL